MEDIAAVEYFVQTAIFVYDFDIVNGSMFGELARRSVGKLPTTMPLLGHISQICHVSDINALFKAYRCSSCDQALKKAQQLEQHLTT